MSYPTIVLHLDQGAHLARRSDCAIHLARELGSHVVALAASDRTLLEMGLSTRLPFTEEFTDALEAVGRRARLRAELFAMRAQVARFPDFEAVVEDDDELLALLRRSRCCDLVIVANPDTTASGRAAARARRLLDTVLLDSVAPTLMLPEDGQVPALGGHALVGWNGSAEAARAIAGALPLLQQSRRVTLLQCRHPSTVERPAGLADVEWPREWLARHGVHAETWSEPTSADAGQALRDAVEALGADLLVMGAWGHRRWAERLLGGATRTVLDSVRVPVLMAH